MLSFAPALSKVGARGGSVWQANLSLEAPDLFVARHRQGETTESRDAYFQSLALIGETGAALPVRCAV